MRGEGREWRGWEGSGCIGVECCEVQTILKIDPDSKTSLVQIDYDLMLRMT